MSFVNATRYLAMDVPMPDPNGREMIIAIVKATFDVLEDGRVVPAEEPEPIALNDECWERDNPRSSLKSAGDVCIEKRGTDVVVLGEAVSKTPVKHVDLAVRVRDVTVPLRVHGERLFQKGAFGVVVGPAVPFTRMTLQYERAYGGATEDFLVVDERNPSGVGLARNANDLVGTPAPQIEHPARPHTKAKDDHPPAGFGPIMSHWLPRRTFAGTFDGAWRDTRMPLMPLDFDIRHNNVAHPALQLETPLLPGDEIAVNGMSEKGVFVAKIPTVDVVVRARFDRSGKVEARPVIDTLVVRPEQRRFVVVLRRAFARGRGGDVLRELRVDGPA